ncbi:hypothetical protein EI94DRAFT_1726689, partial [Lactarius quietus]
MLSRAQTTHKLGTQTSPAACTSAHAGHVLITPENVHHAPVAHYTARTAHPPNPYAPCRPLDLSSTLSEPERRQEQQEEEAPGRSSWDAHAQADDQSAAMGNTDLSGIFWAATGPSASAAAHRARRERERGVHRGREGGAYPRRFRPDPPGDEKTLPTTTTPTRLGSREGERAGP